MPIFCLECGAKVYSPEAIFCPNCGHDLTVVTHRQKTIKKRLTEVSILAGLQVLGGLAFSLLGAIILIPIGFIIPPPPPDYPASAIFALKVVTIVGSIILVVGVLGFAVAYGYWNGRGWAWTLGMMIAVPSLTFSLLTILSNIVMLSYYNVFTSWGSLLLIIQSIASLIINGLIIYYLTRPYVKRWFGKTSSIDKMGWTFRDRQARTNGGLVV